DRFCGSLRLYRPDGTRLPHDECPMADALGGRVQRNLEVQIERPDGSRRWALVNIAPIHDDDGAVIGAVNAFLDVTELKAAQDALRHSEAELHDFFENGALPLHWVGPDGTILRANRAELELLGYDREEYVGRKIRDFHVDAEAIDDILARLTAGESLHNYPARLRAKDGSIRDVLITSNVFRREGEFVHTRCFTRDVSDLRRIAAEREALLAREQAARTAAEAAARAKDEFLAMLGHELRNPLGVITNAVAILDRVGATIPSAVSARGAIRRHAGHLGALVDDLLDVARVTLGKIALKRARLDLGHATMRWLATFRSSGNADAHEIVADVATVWVDADETRIDQIASNLIGNAVKYTPAGGRIRVSVRREGDEAIFEVTDSGVGISSALLPRVFDLFTQGERTLARSEGGLGLGLTLVKHLAELHGGRAEAASDGPGQGARFTVRLPVAAPAEAAGMAVAERRAVAPAARRVLLVEDNDDAREMLRMLLELDGHEVHEAADGITALEKAPVLAPDVVILDVGLPGIDGYETARRLRALPRGRSMRLVAVTGYGQPGDKRLAQEAGFDGHIVKPVDTDALRRQLAS
ncbi:MAG TPA: ATP-binding protein, partial [Terriglobales bacterium]|nr:ATP-binding protein [Terriglobales bacterium]